MAVLTTGSTISTFDAAQFAIDQANFDRYNAGTGGVFSVVRGDSLGRSDTDLSVVSTAVPEPGTLALAVTGLAVASWVARWHRSRG